MGWLRQAIHTHTRTRARSKVTERSKIKRGQGLDAHLLGLIVRVERLGGWEGVRFDKLSVHAGSGKLLNTPLGPDWSCELSFFADNSATSSTSLLCSGSWAAVLLFLLRFNITACLTSLSMSDSSVEFAPWSSRPVSLK